MNAESKGIIVQASKMLYEKYPDLKSIHWTQYTPYFNDGDECEFGVHEICFTYGADETEEDLEPYDSNIYPLYSEATVNMWAERAKNASYAIKYRDDAIAWRKENPELAEFADDFDKFQTAVGNIPDDVMKATFGNHVMVQITRDNLIIEEYDHD